MISYTSYSIIKVARDIRISIMVPLLFAEETSAFILLKKTQQSSKGLLWYKRRFNLLRH